MGPRFVQARKGTAVRRRQYGASCFNGAGACSKRGRWKPITKSKMLGKASLGPRVFQRRKAPFAFCSVASLPEASMGPRLFKRGNEGHDPHRPCNSAHLHGPGALV